MNDVTTKPLEEVIPFEVEVREGEATQEEAKGKKDPVHGTDAA